MLRTLVNIVEADSRAFLAVNGKPTNGNSIEHDAWNGQGQIGGSRFRVLSSEGGALALSAPSRSYHIGNCHEAFNPFELDGMLTPIEIRYRLITHSLLQHGLANAYLERSFLNK